MKQQHYTDLGWKPPTHDSLHAKITRLFSNLSYCGRCGMPWRSTESHTTKYRDSGQGCFPLCETCWAKLTPDQRLPYYDALVDVWIFQSPGSRSEYEKDRVSIHAAVLAGK